MSNEKRPFSIFPWKLLVMNAQLAEFLRLTFLIAAANPQQLERDDENCDNNPP